MATKIGPVWPGSVMSTVLSGRKVQVLVNDRSCCDSTATLNAAFVAYLNLLRIGLYELIVPSPEFRTWSLRRILARHLGYLSPSYDDRTGA
jgi:hypothetical protein